MADEANNSIGSPNSGYVRLIHDAHNHLHHPDLDDVRDKFLSNRDSSRIGFSVVNGTSESDWSDVLRLAATADRIIPAVGVHPWNVDDVSPDWKSTLREHWSRGATVGEIGLDRWKTKLNFDNQLEIFCWQWLEAVRMERVVSVHCLRAWGALLDWVREHPHRKPGFLLHAYGGPVECVDEWVSLGAYFSFSASFVAPGRERKLLPFHRIPRDRLLVETDAPAMPPPGGSQIHHPLAIVSAYSTLADVLKCELEELENQIEENFHALFLS